MAEQFHSARIFANELAERLIADNDPAAAIAVAERRFCRV
jgi:hypothetical protein